MDGNVLITGDTLNWKTIRKDIYEIGFVILLVFMIVSICVIEGGDWSLAERMAENSGVNLLTIVIGLTGIWLVANVVYLLFNNISIVVYQNHIEGTAFVNQPINIGIEQVKKVNMSGKKGLEIVTDAGIFKFKFVKNNHEIIQLISEMINMNEGVKFKTYGVNGQLYVYDNKVVIERRGVMGFLLQGKAGGKTIPISNIMSVQFQEASGFTNGFIQFGIMGGLEAKGGLLKAVDDENAVIFSADNNGIVREIRDFIEGKIINKSNGTTIVQQQLSNADELKKYKELLDLGVLSQEEFDIKKKQILGI